MSQTNEQNTLSTWISNLLSKRNLSAPDGRDLYEYRITDEEFDGLERLLQDHIVLVQSYIGFANLSTKHYFPRLFVIYCAEWWRRRYDGRGFSWEPILKDLRANSDQWKPQDRSKCVRKGLRDWKLRELQSSGFRFLGSIAVQGGLPMKPLAEARGGIGGLLGRVLRLANNRVVDPTDIQNWVESLQNYLPKTYRHDAIFVLLAKVAWTVLMLKQKAGLDSNVDAITRLDSKIPDWRKDFPLPIKDDQARSLIEHLVREAATVRVQKSAVILPVERFMESFTDEEWNISSIIDLPDIIEAHKLAKLFEVERDELPRFAELSVNVGDQKRKATIRKMAGSSSFRIEDETWGFSGDAAMGEHLFRLTSRDGRVWNAPSTNGFALEVDLPSIFSDENGTYRFINQGSGGVSGNEAIFVLPKDWKINNQYLDAVEQIGVLNVSTNEIYRTTETIVLEDSYGSVCKIKVKSADENSESYQWRGQRWWLNFISPSIAFKGKPNLFLVDENGSSRNAKGEIKCKAIGSSISGQWLGPVTISHLAGGELKHKSRMTLLPKDADLSIDLGDALSGTIIFDGWHLSRVIVTSAEVNSKQTIEGDKLVLDVSVLPECRTPDQLRVELFWEHNSTSVKLTLPFPSSGTRGFDKNGNELEDGSLLALNQILGVRLSVLDGGNARNIKLKIQTNKGGLSRRHFLKPLPGAISLEVRLSDYLTDFEHLLTLNDSPDSKVKVSLLINYNESFTLNIARYSTVIERADDSILIPTEKLRESNTHTEELSVLAVRLEDPDEEPIALEYKGDSAEGNSKWFFSPETRLPGAWLIYPSAESEFVFRPTLWTVQGEISEDSELAKATNIVNEFDRQKAFDNLILELAEDFSHPDWEGVTRLAELVGHLPLTTLYLWRRFAHSAAGMAALAFRYGKLPKGFVTRFEQELPFSWEIVPFNIWRTTFNKSFKYCKKILGNDSGKTIFDAHCQRRIENLTARHGGLSFMLGIASVELFPEKQRDTDALRRSGEDAVNRLFVDEHSHLMNLRIIHADDVWVTDSEKLLEHKWGDPNRSRYFHTEDLWIQNQVINMPPLLATEAALGCSASWLKNPAKIHLLRTFRAFDPEWFDEAFNWTIVRCLADGLLDKE